MAITFPVAHHYCLVDTAVHGPEIFKTMIHFPNHEHKHAFGVSIAAKPLYFHVDKWQLLYVEKMLACSTCAMDVRRYCCSSPLCEPVRYEWLKT